MSLRHLLESLFPAARREHDRFAEKARLVALAQEDIAARIRILERSVMSQQAPDAPPADVSPHETMQPIPARLVLVHTK